MDDLAYGTRNKRGDWAPNEPAEIAPIWRLPPQPLKVLKWLPHYFLPWNVLFALSAVAYWAWVIPPVETMRTPVLGLVALALRRSTRSRVFLFYGAFELHLYVLQRQGSGSSTTASFPSEQKSKAFWFESQNVDNMPAHLPVRRDDLDGDRGAGPVGLRQRLCALAELRRASRSISSALALVRADHPRVPFLLHPPADPHAVRSTSGCIRCTTTRSTPRPGRRCRCIRSSTCSISAWPSST